MSKSFAKAFEELLVADGAKDNGERLLAYFGGATSALQDATVEELRRVHSVLVAFDSPFAPVIAAQINIKLGLAGGRPS